MSMIIGAIAGKLAEITVGFAKNSIDIKLEKNQLELDIQRTIEECLEHFEVHEETVESLFAPLTEYFWDDHLELVKKATLGSSRERKTAKAQLYREAYNAATIDSNDAKQIIYTVIHAIIETVKQHYRTKLPDETKAAMAEMTDDIVATDNENTKAVLDKLDRMERLYRNPINQFAVQEMVERKDTVSLIDACNMLEHSLGKAHFLYPDYGIGRNSFGDYVSKPLSSAAMEKYPPIFKLKCVASIGDRVLPQLTDADIEYADRHQHRITFDVLDAKKYLGQFEDQLQDEAQRMIGVTLVKEPKPFAPSEPYNIQINHCVVYNYIELRINEVLDDGTVVVSNKEQENCPIVFTLRIRENSSKCEFSLSLLEKTNKTLLQYQKFIEAIMDGKTLTIYSLKNGRSEFEGSCGDFKEGEEHNNLKKEIEIIEYICELEDYFKTRIEIPTEITISEFQHLKYLHTLIKNREYNSKGGIYKLDMIMHEETKENISGMKDQDLVFVADTTSITKLFGQAFEVPIRKIIQPAKVLDLDALKEKVNNMAVGDAFSIKIDATIGTCTDLIPTENEDGMNTDNN